MNEDIPLYSLPKEAIYHVASFLAPRDASLFSTSSKHIFSVLKLKKIGYPVVLLPAGSHFLGEYHDKIRTAANITTTAFGTLHTIVLETDWRDQGWGGRKGRLYVVATDSNGPVEARDHFESGRVVVASPAADHVTTHLRMEFQPRSNETYRLWMFVGDHGGHELFFDTPLDLHAVGLMDEHSFMEIEGEYWGY